MQIRACATIGRTVVGRRSAKIRRSVGTDFDFEGKADREEEGGGGGEGRYAVEFRVARVPRSRVDAYLYSYSLYHTHPLAQIIYPISHPREENFLSLCQSQSQKSLSMSMTSQILDLTTPIMIPG